MIDVAELSAGFEVRCDEHTGFHTVNSFAPKVSESSIRSREKAASIRVHFVSLCVYRGGKRCNADDQSDTDASCFEPNLESFHNYLTITLGGRALKVCAIQLSGDSAAGLRGFQDLKSEIADRLIGDNSGTDA